MVAPRAAFELTDPNRLGRSSPDQGDEEGENYGRNLLSQSVLR